MKKFSDWIAENVEFEDNDPNSLYVKYHNKETGEKGHILRGQQKSMLNKNIDNQEQLKSFSVFKEPKNGDRMYSMYRGKKFVGIFFSDHTGKHKEKVDDKLMGAWYPDHLKGATGVRMPGHLMFPPISGIQNPFKVHEHGGLQVGYEGPIVWDQKEGMFYAPSDSD